MKAFLDFITPIVIIFSVCFPMFYFGFIRKELKERKLERIIDQEVIKGNKVAIEIRKSLRFINSKDEELIMAALACNKSAMEALRIDIKEEKK